jgi:titin
VILNNSIVANSRNGGDLVGSYTGSHDLIGNGSGSGLTSPLKGNPVLGPLGNYGGPTQTIPLLPGSPARGAGVVADYPGTSTPITTDQRGFPLAPGKPDIGAFQTQTNPFLVTTTADPGGLVGLLSLREAVNLANAYQGLAGTAAITFDIPTTDPNYKSTTRSYLLHLLSALPKITVPVVIDGTSEPGYSNAPLIEIDGTAVPPNSNGFTLEGGNSTVKGLDIHSFQGSAIALVNLGGDTIEGNYLGTDITGKTAKPNTTAGIYISGAGNNTIGGTTAAARNVISGNYIGVYMLGNATGGTVIEGNYIGTDVTGTAALGNILFGVELNGAGSITVGGTASGAGNVISDNTMAGIYLTGSTASGNTIEGNVIGTNAAGTAALANGTYGIALVSAGGGNTIGGVTASARNLISGNSNIGVAASGSTTGTVIEGNYIGTNAAGTGKLANAGFGIYFSGTTGNTIGGTASGAGNLISGNGTTTNSIAVGLLAGSNNNRVEGNDIGTNAAGSASVGNSGDGILVRGSTGNTIGGSVSGAGNVISGNGLTGIELDSGTTGTVVAGNRIGTDSTGTTAVGNAAYGIDLFGASSTTIGGTTSGARNVISGNKIAGIYVQESTATGNTVEGNYIGTNAAGTAALANTRAGVYINGAGHNTIGGTTATARNVISGNLDGVLVLGSGTTGDTIEGNYIGTDVTGATAVSNTNLGVFLSGASGVLVGGTASGAGNVISGNTKAGVYLDSGAAGNTVEGNVIGLKAAGTAALANGIGVYLTAAGSGNRVGGTTTSAGNVISGNLSTGVYVSSTTGTVIQGNSIGTNAARTGLIGNVGYGIDLKNSSGNTLGGAAATGNVIAGNGTTTRAAGVLVAGSNDDTILADSIFSNGGLGISLNRGNNSEAAPVLTSATYSSGTLTLSGSVTGTVGATLTVEFFSNPTGSAQGETYLGSTTVTVPASGTATFSGVTFTTALTAKGDDITATATDGSGNTSEFSTGLVVS